MLSVGAESLAVSRCETCTATVCAVERLAGLL